MGDLGPVVAQRSCYGVVAAGTVASPGSSRNAFLTMLSRPSPGSAAAGGPLRDSPDWNRLDAAAFAVSMRRSVRRLAWVGAVVGAILIACGLAGDLPPMTALGAVLLCAGAWNICRPSTTGLIVDGVAMILTGTFNCVAWLWIEDARPSSVGKWIFAGVVQIVWGVRRLAVFRTARFAANDREAIAHLGTVVRELSKRSAKVDTTVAEFRTGRFHIQRNRLGIFPDGVIALLGHEAVRLEKRSDIWIEPSGSTSLGRSIRVRIQMSDLQLNGRMPTAHFERFERWKLGQSQSRPAAA